jgi:2-polyprenyl-3-methyl-5-hydroxy-6-metoxy-1,4-benzoquinol methylase
MPTQPTDAGFSRLRADAGGGYDPGFFERLAAVEPRSFWFRERNRLIVRLVSELMRPGERFLEVGCGTGLVLSALSRECGLRVTGGELFSEALEHASRRVPEARLELVDATRMAYAQAFDGVGAFDVLEHIPDDLAAIRGLGRAVRVGGHVFIAVPQHRWLWSAFDDHSRHVRRYRRAELAAKVRQAGLTPIRATSFVTSLLPLMALSRWRRRTLRSDYDPISDLAPPAAVDRVLAVALRLEVALIGRGFDLPVGGSLVLVARRDRP